MKGLMRGIVWVGLMCANAGVFADSVTFNVGPHGDYRTIQKAIDAATANDIVTINVAAGTYDENITLRTDITFKLIGLETAQTFLRAQDNSKPIITAKGVRNCRISRFTFINSNTGIELSNSSAVSIAANVFSLGTGGTAIKADATDASTIINNTFYANKLALSRAESSSTIQNNIFASNTTAISSTDKKTTGIDHNLFTPAGADGQMSAETTILTADDPLFVNPADRDFHLETIKSAAHDAGSGIDNDLIDGSPPDIGAYGGLYADPTPFPVKNVKITEKSLLAGAFKVSVTWAPNESYLIKSYNAKYELTGSTDNSVFFEDSTTPSTSQQGVTNGFTLSGTADITAGSIDQPELNPIIPGSQSLTLSWNSIPEATSYEILYGIEQNPISAIVKTTVDAGNVTAYTLTGLQNKTTYRVWVVAVKQPILRITSINAVDSLTPPHISNDSTEVTIALGLPIKSVESDSRPGIPEEVVAFPALPNEGCFIATAAYGSYSAAQVKTLRDFRDRYLLTHSAGRAFVGWYYANSPPAAHYLNQHPALKPVVRGLLLPLVFITSWINGSTPAMQAAIILLALGMISFGIYWRRRTSWG